MAAQPTITELKNIIIERHQETAGLRLRAERAEVEVAWLQAENERLLREKEILLWEKEIERRNAMEERALLDAPPPAKQQ